MFVCNFKVNKKAMFKLFFVLCIIIALVITGISVYRIFGVKHDADEMNAPSVANITTQNYTNILKTVHENLDTYIGQKISFVGYVYRVYDFNETQFVLARDMVISSDNQTLVVGFLCNSTNAKNFADGSWVSVTGKITEGDYHGSIPVIEVTNMKSCDKPKDEFVYPPDDTYIPTSVLF